MSWLDEPTIDLPHALPVGDDGEPVERDQAESPTLLYAGAEQWIEEWLAPTLGQNPDGWCGWWWRHPEAVERLASLWAAWETARVEGGIAPSAWWVQHFTPHWSRLAGPSGVFSLCDRRKCAAIANQHLELHDRPTTTEGDEPR